MKYFLLFCIFYGCLFAQPVEYTYDNAGRLIQAKYENNNVIKYTYDNRGNQIKKEIIGGNSHTVSLPNVPIGPSVGKPQEELTYQTGNSQCNQGHEIEYSMDWGDGTAILWGNEKASHAYKNPAEYQIRAQARCKQDNSVLSDWSANKKVTIRDENNQPPLSPELISPANNATNVSWEELTFVWKKTTDPENDPISYNLVYSTEPMTGNSQKIPGDPLYGKYFFIGICLILPLVLGKKKSYMLLSLVLFMLVIACKDSGKNPVVNDQMSQTVRNLRPATRYFWRVNVQDAFGNQNASEIRTFVTKN